MDASVAGDDSLDPNSGLAQALMRSPTYINPAYVTPEQMAALRLMAEKQQTSPEAKSWTGALGQTLQAFAAQQTLGRAAGLDQLRGAERYKANNWQGAGAGAGASAANASSSADGVDPQSLVSAYAPQLGAAGAAGLVGGFGAESGYSPTASGDGGHAIGIAQWNDRAPTLKAYAAKYGKSPTDPEIQKRFPLVEMGLAGDPSDPGFGTERAAGQALMGARTPQEATAAALMYERPRGYSAAHPEDSNAYGKRLALAAALMGGQGGAGASAMAYAPSAGNAGGMPPVGPGAGRAVPLGAGGGAGTGPMAAGPVMAQNAPPSVAVPGGAPVQGSPAYARIMSNSSPEMDSVKRSILLQQEPQTFTDATGGVHQMRPNLTGQGQLTPGNLSGTISPQSVPTNQPTWGGKPSGSTIFPGSGGGQAPADGNAAMPTTVPGWQEYFRKQQALEAANSTMGEVAKKVPQYRGALSVLDMADKAADNIDDVGTITKLKAYAQEKTGIPIGDNLPSLDTFKALVNNLVTMLPPGVAGISPEVLGSMSTTPEGRHQIIANLRSMIEYGVQLGEKAGDYSKPTEKRWNDYQTMKPPQPKWSLPEKAPTGGGAAAGSGSGGSAAAAPAADPAYAAAQIARARTAIANGKSRAAAIKLLRDNGITPPGDL